MRYITININAEHITDGVHGSNNYCPLANALRSLFTTTTNVSVGRSSGKIDGRPFFLGLAAQAFGNHWEKHYTVVPQVVTIMY